MSAVWPLGGILRRASRGRIFRRAEDVPMRRWAIVLGARVHEDGEPSFILADRLHAAHALWSAGRVERVLVSGDDSAESNHETRAMARWLEGKGVPVDRIEQDPAGVRTSASMANAAARFGVEDAVVCTNAFHLPRSLFLARRAGIDAVGINVDRRVYRVRTRLRQAFREPAAQVRAVLESSLPLRG